MVMEKALGLVLRTTDYSETSRIATIWTREFGKVRVLAKGGRRLRSSFDSALDLLTLCSMVFVRKSSGSLDLLTEARVEERFARLRASLPALYGGYYVAELLGDWTEEYDPHPELFAEAIDTLRSLGTEVPTPIRLLRFEMVLLRELGYAPVLDACATCKGELPPTGLIFSSAAGGLLCRRCRSGSRGRVELSAAAVAALRRLAVADQWRSVPRDQWGNLRRLFNEYITYLRGRPPRCLAYLGSGWS